MRKNDPLFNHTLLEIRRSRSNSEAYFNILDYASTKTIDIVTLDQKNYLEILEIGSRQGIMAKKLLSKFPHSNISITEPSITLSRMNPLSSITDSISIEDLPAIGKYDLIISCLNWHWINFLPEYLIKLNNLLSANGKIIGCFYGDKSLNKLRRLLITTSGDKVHSNIIPFYSSKSFSELLLALNFFNPVVEKEKIEIQTKNPIELMKYLKKIGENNHLNTDHYYRISKEQYSKIKEYREANFTDSLEIIFFSVSKAT